MTVEMSLFDQAVPVQCSADASTAITPPGSAGIAHLASTFGLAQSRSQNLWLAGQVGLLLVLLRGPPPN